MKNLGKIFGWSGKGRSLITFLAIVASRFDLLSKKATEATEQFNGTEDNLTIFKSLSGVEVELKNMNEAFVFGVMIGQLTTTKAFAKMDADEEMLKRTTSTKEEAVGQIKQGIDEIKQGESSLLNQLLGKLTAAGIEAHIVNHEGTPGIAINVRRGDEMQIAEAIMKQHGGAPKQEEKESPLDFLKQLEQMFGEKKSQEIPQSLNIVEALEADLRGEYPKGEFNNYTLKRYLGISFEQLKNMPPFMHKLAREGVNEGMTEEVLSLRGKIEPARMIKLITMFKNRG